MWVVWGACSFINLRVIIAGILEVMNSGFSLLNPPIESGGSPELKARFSKLEGRLDALKRHTVGQAHGNGHGHPRSPRTSTLGLDENPAMKRASIVESYAKNVLARIPSASKRDPNEPITITTHHRVRWECIEEFEEWQVRFNPSSNCLLFSVASFGVWSCRADD